MATLSGGVKVLRKIQFGKESTAGTAVAATSIWRGMGLMEDQREIKHVAEEVGIALPTTRNYTPKFAAAVNFDPIEATFQQLPYLFEAGVATEVPTQDGAGSGYIYAYTFPSTSLNALTTYTIEGGNNQQVQEMEYSFVRRFKISGNQAEGVMMEAEWIGRQVKDASFTAALSVPTLVPGDHISFGGSNLYLDAAGGTIGSTEVTSMLYSFELDVETGYVPVPTNRFKYFDYVQWVGTSFNATLKMVYRHNTSAETEKATYYEGNLARLVRLAFTGNALSTPGTETNLNFRIDAAGVYTEMSLGDVDGNDVKRVTMQIGHDLTASKGLEFRVVNELTTLP